MKWNLKDKVVFISRFGLQFTTNIKLLITTENWKVKMPLTLLIVIFIWNNFTDWNYALHTERSDRYFSQIKQQQKNPKITNVTLDLTKKLLIHIWS